MAIIIHSLSISLNVCVETHFPSNRCYGLNPHHPCWYSSACTRAYYKFTLFHTDQNSHPFIVNISCAWKDQHPFYRCPKNMHTHRHTHTFMYADFPLMAAAIAIVLYLFNIFRIHRTKATIELKQRMEHNKLLHFVLVYFIRSLFARCSSCPLFNRCLLRCFTFLFYVLHFEMELSHQMWPMDVETLFFIHFYECIKGFCITEL